MSSNCTCTLSWRHALRGRSPSQYCGREETRTGAAGGAAPLPANKSCTSSTAPLRFFSMPSSRFSFLSWIALSSRRRRWSSSLQPPFFTVRTLDLIASSILAGVFVRACEHEHGGGERVAVLGRQKNANVYNQVAEVVSKRANMGRWRRNDAAPPSARRDRRPARSAWREGNPAGRGVHVSGARLLHPPTRSQRSARPSSAHRSRLGLRIPAVAPHRAVSPSTRRTPWAEARQAYADPATVGGRNQQCAPRRRPCPRVGQGGHDERACRTRLGVGHTPQCGGGVPRAGQIVSHERSLTSALYIGAIPG